MRLHAPDDGYPEPDYLVYMQPRIVLRGVGVSRIKGKCLSRGVTWRLAWAEEKSGVPQG
jgi:hypothetical protein